MRIFLLPIEPYDMRYTAQWIRWFQEDFRKLGIDWVLVEGEKLAHGETIREGCVLDVYGTNTYKMTQMTRMIELIRKGEVRDGDVVFLLDGWFPGVEALFYIRDMTKLKFKVYSFFHAGTYDSNDFTAIAGMAPWGEDIENGWFVGYDGIFVATHFHRKFLLRHRRVDSAKVYVTGLPLRRREVWKAVGLGDHSVVKGELLRALVKRKRNLVVFPHRLDAEKNPWVFDELEKNIVREGGLAGRPPSFVGEVEFVKTHELALSKAEYYQLLSEAKIVVSASDHEFFGIGTAEAVMLGALPVVPDRLSYLELYLERFRYACPQLEGKGRYDLMVLGRMERMIVDCLYDYDRVVGETFVDSLSKLWGNEHAIENMVGVMAP